MKYVLNIERYVSQDSLGLSEFELSEGDRIIIFFDKDDNIRSAYPNSGVDNAQDASDRIHDIMAELKKDE